MMAEDVQQRGRIWLGALDLSKQRHLLICICKLRLLSSRWRRCGGMRRYHAESFLLRVWLEVVSVRCDGRCHISVRHVCGIMTFLWSDIGNGASRRWWWVGRQFARWSWRSVASSDGCLASQKLLQCGRHSRELERGVLARQHLRRSMQLLRESDQRVRIVVRSPFTLTRLRTIEDVSRQC